MKPAIINGRWELVVPDHIADWDALNDWERCRFASMEEHLRSGQILWDVGTEHGELSAIYAEFVGGGRNMVLIEPTAQFWPNIRMIWESNGLLRPLACVQALIDETTKAGDNRSIFKDNWPAASDGGEQNARAYSYIHDPGSSAGLAHWRLDDLAANLRHYPDAITIDVEGAELRVLKGASRILREARPIVWVSVHPEMMQRDYHVTPRHLFGFMEEMDYSAELLGVDHEEHFVFSPVVSP